MKVFEAPESFHNLENVKHVGTFIPIPADIPNVRNIKIHDHRIEVTNVVGCVNNEPQYGIYEHQIEWRMY